MTTPSISQALQKARELAEEMDLHKYSEVKEYEPEIIKAFPSIVAELERLTEAYGKMRDALDACSRMASKGIHEEIEEEADKALNSLPPL